MHSLDQPAQVFCENCTDAYCDVCFAAQHRKGTRKGHVTKPLQGKQNRPKQNGTHNKEGANGDDVSTVQLSVDT